MTTYRYDLAFSAVPYDALLVAELTALLGDRLPAPVVWQDAHGEHNGGAPATASPLGAGTSRIAVILHQRLWQRDPGTERDDVVLRERVRTHPQSVRIVTLDDQAVPRWLDGVPRCDLPTAGIEGVAAFLVTAIADGGGRPRPSTVAEPRPSGAPSWREGPPSFLRTPRAHSALRHELDVLAAALKPLDDAKSAVGAVRAIELHALPNRLVLRHEEVGISFSWVAGSSGTVADGRLLVIQWEGVTPSARGLSALRTATPVRERVYRAEGDAPESWYWRADSPNGRACSTKHLAAEWLAGASIATATALAARVGQ